MNLRTRLRALRIQVAWIIVIAAIVLLSFSNIPKRTIGSSLGRVRENVAASDLFVRKERPCMVFEKENRLVSIKCCALSKMHYCSVPLRLSRRPPRRRHHYSPRSRNRWSDEERGEGWTTERNAAQILNKYNIKKKSVAATGKRTTYFRATEDEHFTYSYAAQEEKEEVEVAISAPQHLAFTNFRNVTAEIKINALPKIVWNLITDYENLHKIVPNLAVNQVVERWDGGARLLQVGEQRLISQGSSILGANFLTPKLTFRARCTLDCQEYLKSEMKEGGEGYINFVQVKGDFEDFSGSWFLEALENDNNDCDHGDSKLSHEEEKMEQQTSSAFDYSSATTSSPSQHHLHNNQHDHHDHVGLSETSNTGICSTTTTTTSTLLRYNLGVRPAAWLPVRLIERRMANDVKQNLNAIRQAAERIQLKQQQQQQQQRDSGILLRSLNEKRGMKELVETRNYRKSTPSALPSSSSSSSSSSSVLQENAKEWEPHVVSLIYNDDDDRQDKEGTAHYQDYHSQPHHDEEELQKPLSLSSSSSSSSLSSSASSPHRRSQQVFVDLGLTPVDLAPPGVLPYFLSHTTIGRAIGSLTVPVPFFLLPIFFSHGTSSHYKEGVEEEEDDETKENKNLSLKNIVNVRKRSNDINSTSILGRKSWTGSRYNAATGGGWGGSQRKKRNTKNSSSGEYLVAWHRMRELFGVEKYQDIIHEATMNPHVQSQKNK